MQRDKGFCLDSTTMTLSVCVQEKSRHFTARTCNCIIIVLDAIKPITHKRLIKASNLHAMYLCSQQDRSNHSRGTWDFGQTSSLLSYQVKTMNSPGLNHSKSESNIFVWGVQIEMTFLVNRGLARCVREVHVWYNVSYRNRGSKEANLFIFIFLRNPN